MIITRLGMDTHFLPAFLLVMAATICAGLARETYAADEEVCDQNKVYPAEKAACSFDGVLCCWYNKGGTQFGKWSLSSSTETPEVKNPEGDGFLLLKNVGDKDSITGIIWSPNFTLSASYDVMSFQVYCGHGSDLEVHVLYLDDGAKRRGELLPDNEEEVCEEEAENRWMKRYFKMQRNDEWNSTEGKILTLVLHGSVVDESLAVKGIKFYTNGTKRSTESPGSSTSDTTTLKTTTEVLNVSSSYESTTMNQSSSTITNGTTETQSTTVTENTDETTTITDNDLCSTINTTNVSTTTTTTTETDEDTETETTTNPTTTTTETATNSTCSENQTTTTTITSSETTSSINSNETTTATSVSTEETTVSVSENVTDSTYSVMTITSNDTSTTSRSTEETSTITITTSNNVTESTYSETSSVTLTEIDTTTTTQAKEETSTVTDSENVTTITYSETQSISSDSVRTHDTSTITTDYTTEPIQLHSSMATWEEALLGTFVLFCVFALSLFMFNFVKKLYGRRKLWILRKGNLDPIFPEEGPGVIKMKVFANKSPEV